MKSYIVKILETFFVTHDVKSFFVERPQNFDFEPGQATDVAIHKKDWVDELRPFTFTSLPDDKFLQFIIKTYPLHEGVTNQMLLLSNGDELVLHETFGAIQYDGPGTFIAGGAGITPFVSIFRNLQKQKKIEGNRLIFANKTSEDIILKKEFEGLLGEDFINILSAEKVKEHAHGMITEDFLKAKMKSRQGRFYVCGPPPMMEAVLDHLSHLGIHESSIVKESI